LIKNLLTYDSVRDFCGDVVHLKSEELEYKGTIDHVKIIRISHGISLNFFKTILLDSKENPITFRIEIFKKSLPDFSIRLTNDIKHIEIYFEFYSDQTIKEIEQRNSDYNQPVIDGKINGREIDYLEVGPCLSTIAKK